jgi:hypothetical protein
MWLGQVASEAEPRKEELLCSLDCCAAVVVEGNSKCSTVATEDTYRDTLVTGIEEIAVRAPA